MDKKMITTIIAVFFAIVVGVIGVTYVLYAMLERIAWQNPDYYQWALNRE